MPLSIFIFLDIFKTKAILLSSFSLDLLALVCSLGGVDSSQIDDAEEQEHQDTEADVKERIGLKRCRMREN